MCTRFSPVAATPTFSPGAGAVVSECRVSISSTTAGATICHTHRRIAPHTVVDAVHRALIAILPRGKSQD
jgi:hypothetical protein